MPPHKPPPANALPPGYRLGAYKIQHWIGTGGHAILFVASDKRNHTQVALKFPLVPSEEDIQRLRHEVAMGHVVHHPNICKSVKVATEQGFTFGVMEYVEGENLKSIMRRGGALQRSTAESVAAELCAAASRMHKLGLVHCDLKPDNVMIDDNGHVKIIDLGVARYEGLPEGDPILGTPEYMAPERFLGKVLKAPLDVFAIGVLLYEVFTGSPWLKCDPAADWPVRVQTVLQQQDTLPLPPSKVNSDLDFIIDDLIMSCLERDPEARPEAHVLSGRWAALSG